MKTSINVIRHLKCNYVFTTNVKVIVSRDAEFENFLTGFMARQDYFTHFEQSRTLGGAKSEYHLVRIPLPLNHIHI